MWERNPFSSKQTIAEAVVNEYHYEEGQKAESVDDAIERQISKHDAEQLRNQTGAGLGESLDVTLRHQDL